jgi:hypothetical protein
MRARLIHRINSRTDSLTPLPLYQERRKAVSGRIGPARRVNEAGEAVGSVFVSGFAAAKLQVLLDSRPATA